MNRCVSSVISCDSDLSCPQRRNSQPLHGPLTIASLQLCGHQGLDTKTTIRFRHVRFFYTCLTCSKVHVWQAGTSVSVMSCVIFLQV